MIGVSQPARQPGVDTGANLRHWPGVWPSSVRDREPEEMRAFTGAFATPIGEE